MNARTAWRALLDGARPGGATSAIPLTVMAPLPGRSVIFTSHRRGGRNHVFLLDRETRRLDPLEEANCPIATDAYPSISADGRFIVFESDRLNGRPKIFLFDRPARTLSEVRGANEATPDDGLAAISN